MHMAIQCILYCVLQHSCCILLPCSGTVTLLPPHRELEGHYHASDPDAQNFFKSYKLYLDQLFSTRGRLSICKQLLVFSLIEHPVMNRDFFNVCCLCMLNCMQALLIAALMLCILNLHLLTGFMTISLSDVLKSLSHILCNWTSYIKMYWSSLWWLWMMLFHRDTAAQ